MTDELKCFADIREFVAEGLKITPIVFQRTCQNKLKIASNIIKLGVVIFSAKNEREKCS